VELVTAGGTLKIYGHMVNPDVPYKTLLLSMCDNAAHVVRETLDKYGMDKENPDAFCLVEVLYILSFTDTVGCINYMLKFVFICTHYLNYAFGEQSYTNIYTNYFIIACRNISGCPVCQFCSFFNKIMLPCVVLLV